MFKKGMFKKMFKILKEKFYLFIFLKFNTFRFPRSVTNWDFWENNGNQTTKS